VIAEAHGLRSVQPVIRRAILIDALAMTELVRRAYGPYVARIGREPAPMLADYECVVRNEQAWVAERNGRIVGLLVLRFAHGFVLLDNIAVAPEVQRGGIGSALLAFAEDQGRQAGLSEVRLYTNVAMTENLSYYLHHGYRETHRAFRTATNGSSYPSRSTRNRRRGSLSDLWRLAGRISGLDLVALPRSDG
jgi:ribosomal protein S18 acetylase RimI-like enzyme